MVGRLKVGFFGAAGVVIFVALRTVDLVQTLVRAQPRKRPLTEDEVDRLRPIFGESLRHERIRIVDGRAGLLTTSGRALTMGFTVYLPSYREQTLVHECVHVWQYRTRRFWYIGNSAFHQLDSKTLHRRYQPYDWRPGILAGAAWRQLASAEAQAKFVEDVYARGSFDPDGAGPADRRPGAFFHDGPGRNAFLDGDDDYTEQANTAWQAIRT